MAENYTIMPIDLHKIFILLTYLLIIFRFLEEMLFGIILPIYKFAKLNPANNVLNPKPPNKVPANINAFTV